MFLFTPPYKSRRRNIRRDKACFYSPKTLKEVYNRYHIPFNLSPRIFRLAVFMSEKKQKVLSIGLWHMLSYRINLKILINFGDVKVQKKKKKTKKAKQTHTIPNPRLLKPDVFCCLEKGVFAINERHDGGISKLCFGYFWSCQQVTSVFIFQTLRMADLHLFSSPNNISFPDFIGCYKIHP